MELEAALARSGRALRPQLRLHDVVLAQLLLIVGTPWFGFAAALGWLAWLAWPAAFALFFAPLAATVAYLVGRFPYEGGLYQWTKLALGPRAAALVAWNFAAFTATFLSSLGVQVATALDYARTGAGGDLAASPLMVGGLGAVAALLLVALAWVGVGVSRFLHDAGGLVIVALVAALVALVVLGPRSIGFAHGAPDQPSGILLARATKLAVFALAGFETMAMVAAETHQPRKTLVRSIAIAAPFVAVVYLLGTAAVQRWVPPAEVDLVHPTAQLLARALPGAGGWVAAGLLLFLVRDLAQGSQVFTAASRLPMVAGWDRAIDPAFGAVDGGSGAPRRAILLLGSLVAAAALLTSLGVSYQEAYQRIVGAAGVFFGSTYLVLFSLPWLPIDGQRAPLRLRLCAAAGFVTTTGFVMLSLVPVGEVESPWRFALFVAGVVVSVEAIGWWVVVRRPRIRVAPL